MGYEYDWRVRAGDTDYSGLIYTPRVIACTIEGIEDARAAVGFPNERFQKLPYVPPVVNVDIDYTASIHVSDVLTVTLTPTIGESSVIYDVTAVLNGETAFDGTVTTVFVEKESGNSIPVPDEFAREMQRYGPHDA